MTVSVALATYNGEKFIREQLDSLLNQTVLPDEVVIIDDCSTDNTAEVVREYIASHSLSWKFSVAQSNSGYKRNFYNCLAQCSEDVVFLCDQDDVWYPQKLEKILEVFKNDQACLAVNSSFDMTDGAGEIIAPFGVGKRKTANHGLLKFSVLTGECIEVGLDTVLIYNISPGCTCAFKREVVEEYLKVSECRLPHDWELNIIAAKNGGLRFLNLPLIGYRQHGNNAIGLSEDESFGPLKMRGSVDVRFKMFDMQKAQLEAVLKNVDSNDLNQVRFCRALEIFCSNREKILRRGKLFPCFENLMYFGRLRNVATIHFRGIVGDFVYILKCKVKADDKQCN